MVPILHSGESGSEGSVVDLDRESGCEMSAEKALGSVIVAQRLLENFLD